MLRAASGSYTADTDASALLSLYPNNMIVCAQKLLSFGMRSGSIPTTALYHCGSSSTTLMWTMGHELRTSLTILRGSLQLLEATAEKCVNLKLTSAARKSVEQLMNLVETVIAFSDASTGELRLNERRCELGDIFAEIADLQLPGADGIMKSITLEEGLLTQQVFIDSDQIKLALNALALNAINHGGHRPRDRPCGEQSDGQTGQISCRSAQALARRFLHL